MGWVCDGSGPRMYDLGFMHIEFSGANGFEGAWSLDLSGLIEFSRGKSNGSEWTGAELGRV